MLVGIDNKAICIVKKIDGKYAKIELPKFLQIFRKTNFVYWSIFKWEKEAHTMGFGNFSIEMKHFFFNTNWEQMDDFDPFETGIQNEEKNLILKWDGTDEQKMRPRKFKDPTDNQFDEKSERSLEFKLRTRKNLP